MSGSGGFAVSRTPSGDRFYNSPAMRRHQHLLLQQQQQVEQRRHQQQKQLRSEPAAEAEARTDSDDSTLSKPSVCSASPPRPAANMTNIDRLVESVTPVVPAQYTSEASIRGWRTREIDHNPFFFLGDLWESFKEWSVYGVGVPLLLNGSDSVKQYYVPFLSGIQLYIDPRKPLSWLRRPGEESDAESSRETSSAGSSDCEAERRAKGVADGAWSQHNPMNLNSQRMSRLSLREKSHMSSSSDEAEVCNSPGLLVFEYLEQEQPHIRKPLADKISVLAAQFPEIGMYRSCDLLPESWMSVAWYPIYRIPMGQTLRDLDASFLTFHSLSTHSRSISLSLSLCCSPFLSLRHKHIIHSTLCAAFVVHNFVGISSAIGAGKGQTQLHGSSGRKVYGVDSLPKISLPVFGLASYKLKGSILTPSGNDEFQQASSLLQDAGNWLKRLQVDLPDYQFFLSHNSQWR